MTTRSSLWETPGFRESVNNGETNTKENSIVVIKNFKGNENLSFVFKTHSHLFCLPAPVPQREITAKTLTAEVCYYIYIKDKVNVVDLKMIQWHGSVLGFYLAWKKMTKFLCCCQWMVVGPSGQFGPTAQWPVGRGRRFELVPASTPHHETMDPTAVGQRKTFRIVTPLPVLVCVHGNYLHLSIIKTTYFYSDFM